MSSSFSVEHALFVPRQLLFDAWTQPDQVLAWLPPVGAVDAAAQIDARDGAPFEVSWRDPQASEPATRVALRGRFAAIDAPTRFSLLLSNGGAGDGVRLDVEFRGAGDSSRVVMAAAGYAEGTADAQAIEWRSRLERLEAFFSVI